MSVDELKPACECTADKKQLALEYSAETERLKERHAGEIRSLKG